MSLKSITSILKRLKRFSESESILVTGYCCCFDSYDFTIGDNVYAVETVQNLRSYTLSRCNNPLNDTITGLEIKKGHPQDTKAKLFFGDAINRKGETFDMSGGWYDAGDYGKYTTTAAFATAQLMLAYEAHPKHFTQGQFFSLLGSNPKEIYLIF